MYHTTKYLRSLPVMMHSEHGRGGGGVGLVVVQVELGTRGWMEERIIERVAGVHRGREGGRIGRFFVFRAT